MNLTYPVTPLFYFSIYSSRLLILFGQAETLHVHFQRHAAFDLSGIILMFNMFKTSNIQTVFMKLTGSNTNSPIIAFLYLCSILKPHIS